MQVCELEGEAAFVANGIVVAFGGPGPGHQLGPVDLGQRISPYVRTDRNLGKTKTSTYIKHAVAEDEPQRPHSDQCPE